ncbi:MAG: sec-independent protein translocase protein TatB [Chloroflexi bacterium]|jgi:sec-independent protein translocase protein TatB|nr:MAG: sec-independent protein translocase protein TatB [Chloroflexota bacterium]|tara:strand:+ start:4670 stop:5122 length:453 start_codon:yes stop_codon:yes gene_type:complete
MDILGVGILEALLVMVVALIVVGPDKFPEIAKSAGRWFSVARNYAAEVKSDVQGIATEIESEVKREEDLVTNLNYELDQISKEASDNLPKIIDIEPVSKTNIDDFKDKNDAKSSEHKDNIIKDSKSKDSDNQEANLTKKNFNNDDSGNNK